MAGPFCEHNMNCTQTPLMVYNVSDKREQNSNNKNVVCAKEAIGLISFYNTNGKISMTNDYFAELVSAAAKTGFGVAGMSTFGAGDSLRSIVQPNSRDKGVRVTVQNDKLYIDLHITVVYGLNIQAAVRSISHKVRYAVEEATGLKVGRIRISVDDVVV